MRRTHRLHLAAAGLLATVAGVTALALSARAATITTSKQYAYRLQATYTLTRDTVDPATGAHTLVERRLEAEYRLWAIVNEDQVFTGTKGDYAVGEGKAVATVRDDRTAAPCAQSAEVKGRIGLKFVTSRAPLTSAYVSWSPGTATRRPALPCGATDLALWEAGKRGVGDWSQVSGSLFWHESRTTFAADVYKSLAAGRNATFEVLAPSPDATQRASVKLVFTRAADLDPKPKPSTKAVVVTKPVIRGIGRYGAAVWFAVTQGGERVRIANATCTGRIAGGPPVTGHDSGFHYPRVPPPVAKLWPELARATGWVTLAMCDFEHDEYTQACGKTFRGSLRLVVGGKTIVKPVSFRWKAREPC
jgi:hypothetical protein